jgi:transcriptional regulator with XRE-family HTH domain
MRLKRGWTQKKLAQKSGLEQGSISRVENPDYGQLSFETVLAVARGFDCAFVGRFVPFSQLRALVEDTSEETDDLVESFDEEDAALRETSRSDGRLEDAAAAPLPLPEQLRQKRQEPEAEDVLTIMNLGRSRSKTRLHELPEALRGDGASAQVGA